MKRLSNIHLTWVLLFISAFVLTNSATITSTVSAGRSVSLKCIVTSDLDVDIYWSESNPTGGDPYYIAQTRSSEPATFYPDFVNKSFTLNKEKFGLSGSIFTITIRNVTIMDSNDYTCHTFNYKSNTSLDLLTYFVQVVDCACSIDRISTCNLTGLYSQLPVTVHCGNYSGSSEIRNNHIFMDDATFAGSVLNNATEILVTSVQYSQTEIVNVSCAISSLVHSSSPPISSQSPRSASKPSIPTLDKSTVAITQSLPTEKAGDLSTLHLSSSYYINGVETQSAKVKVTATSSPSTSSASSPTSVTPEPTKTRSAISYVTQETTSLISYHDRNTTSTDY